MTVSSGPGKSREKRKLRKDAGEILNLSNLMGSRWTEREKGKREKNQRLQSRGWCAVDIS